ncbi:UDP-3-O-acylglucosamine N-acyltransferase [Azospirillaceae bacterium]
MVFDLWFSVGFPMKLSEIADVLGARLVGDGALEIHRVVHPADAQSSEDLVLAMDKSLLGALLASSARAAVVSSRMEIPDGRLDGCLVVERPRWAMGALLRLFDRPVHVDFGVHPTAVISPEARLGADVAIGPFVVIGPGVVIGDRTRIMSHVSIGADARVGSDGLIHPGVRIGDRVEIGDRVILHHNVSLGADGFSFVTPEPGSVETAKSSGRVGAVNTAIYRINSIGTVIIGHDVEIGANSAVDRGTVSVTRIGNNTKIDNLVQIGHNVVIGDNCMLCGQVGIAGSAVVGNRVVLAGRVAVADHVHIGDDAVVAAMSGVGSAVAPKTVVAGTPAVERGRFFEQIMRLNRLKSLFADVEALKNKVKAIESK